MWFICNSWLVNVFDLIEYEPFYGVATPAIDFSQTYKLFLGKPLLKNQILKVHLPFQTYHCAVRGFLCRLWLCCKTMRRPACRGIKLYRCSFLYCGQWGGIHSGQHVVFSACNTQIILNLNINSGLRMELNRWLLIRLQRPVTTAMQINTDIDISEVRLAFHNSFNPGLNWLQLHKGASGRHNHNDEPLNWWCAVKKGNILKMKNDLLRFFFEHHVHRLMEHWETWWFT